MPNALATAWLCVTADDREAERVLADVLAPLVGRTVEELRALPLPIGPAERCADRLRALADAGAERVFVWPLRDAERQLELFMERRSRCPSDVSRHGPRGGGGGGRSPPGGAGRRGPAWQVSRPRARTAAARGARARAAWIDGAAAAWDVRLGRLKGAVERS